MLAGWLGLDVESVTKAVQQSGRTAPGATRPGPEGSPRDPGLVVEREALKCVLQQPAAVADWYESVEASAYTHASAQGVHAAIMKAGGPTKELAGLLWIDSVLEVCADDEDRRIVRELSVEPLPAQSGYDAHYAASVVARLLELDASRRVEEVKGQLQRTDPVEQAAEHEKVFAELLALEEYRRSLRRGTLGDNAITGN